MSHPSNSHRTAGKSVHYILLAFMAMSLLAYPIAPSRGDETADEVKIGRQAADQVAKESKFITDPALMARVETIGKALTKIAIEKEVPAQYGKSTVAKFNYTFKIVDDKDVNAFSLPGGFVYVNKGLIDYAQSDDELAGVIAHEIGHVAHHHGMQLMKTQNKEMLALVLATAGAALLGAKGDDLSSLAYFGNLISIAKMSHYGRNAEFDADRTAVQYLAGTSYNPVGMLTFMERMARDESRKPEINYGIFRDHPESYLRAQEITQEIEKLGLPVNRRLVTSYMKVDVKQVTGSSAYSIMIAKTEIVRLADTKAEKASVRAKRVAGILSSLLFAGAELHDVKIGNGGQSVVLMDQTLLAPTPEDAALAGMTIGNVVTSSANALKKSFLYERMQTY